MLTPEQIELYYATEGQKPNPLSPLAWLAQQQQAAPAPQTAPTPAQQAAPPPPPLQRPQQQAAPTTDWSAMAAKDPFLAELLKDPAKRAEFEALPEEVKPMFLQAARSLSKSIEAGKVVNPDIEITPQKIGEFYEQAKRELDPYYTEQFNALENDISLSLQRMTDDYNRAVADARDPFRRALDRQAGTEANQGTAFSSGRLDRQNAMVTEQQQRLDDLRRRTEESGQNLLRGYEGQVGSDRARRITLPSLSSATATARGLDIGGPRSLNPELFGGVSFGTIGAARETALRGRQNELESDYRRDRVLNLSPLSY